MSGATLTPAERRRMPDWSPAEDAVLRRLARAGGTKRDVARETGRTVYAVAARAIAIRVKWRYTTVRGRGHRVEPEIFTRRCLRCRQMFDAPSRVQFVCDICHQSDEWRGCDYAPWWRGPLGDSDNDEESAAW